MIKPEELRIGNLVLGYGIDYDSGDNKVIDFEDEEIVCVESINDAGINLITTYLGGKQQIIPEYDTARLEPIPLTDEWISKLGFGSGELIPARVKLDCEYGEVLITFKDVKYVHKLQNLYFELTGIELPKIEPKERKK